MSKVSASGRLNESRLSRTRIRGVVFGLASLSVGSSGSPVFELLLSTSTSCVRRLVLVIPTSIVGKVLGYAIPAPLLSDPESTNAGSVDASLRILVEFVTPQSLRLTDWLAHINGITIHLSVLETISGQEIILGGVRSIFELALDTDIDTGRSNVLCPHPRLAVLAGVLGVSGIQFSLDGFSSYIRRS